MMQFVSQHSFIALCAVIWVCCSIVSIVLRKESPLAIACTSTVLIGLGWMALNHRI